MKPEDLLDAIGEVRDGYIREVRGGRRNARRWGKWTGVVAACLVLALGLRLFFGSLGGEAGGGGDQDLNYMFYTGPVLPLTVRGDGAGITAERNVDFDFSPYTTSRESIEGETEGSERWYSESIVTDSYWLTNTTDADRTLTLVYPHAGALRDYSEAGRFPSITIDGEAATVQLAPGMDVGSFQMTQETEEAQTPTAGLSRIECFEGYELLLSDGRYQELAFEEVPILDQRVVVYRLSDYTYTQDETAANPTIEMAFQMDYEKTYVLTYGMNGEKMDQQTGYRACHKGSIRYDPDALEQFREPNDAYVILLGEDIAGYTIRGYRNGGCDEGDELEDMGCTVTRYESTLGVVLEELIGDYVEKSLSFVYGDDSIVSAGLYCALAGQKLDSYGVLGDEPAERYDLGRIEDLISLVHTDTRVMYFSTEVTILAGERVKVEAVTRRDGSMDYLGGDRNREGYDMAVSLGSNLDFTRQTASISGFGEIEIVGQNFGFEIDSGVTEVLLDPAQEHYWIQVRKAGSG